MKKEFRGMKNSKGIVSLKTLLIIEEKKNCKKFFFESKLGGSVKDSPITEGVVTIQYLPKVGMLGIAESGFNFLTGADYDKSAIMIKEEAQVYLRKYHINLQEEFKDLF